MKLRKFLPAVYVVAAVLAVYAITIAIPAHADINNPHPVPANGSVNTLQLATGAVTDAKTSSTAAIQLSKLGTTNDGTDIPFNNGTNLATSSSFTLDTNGPTIRIPRIAVTTASTSFNGVHYSFPATQGAVSTSLQNDGSGNLSWGTNGASVGVYNAPAFSTSHTASTTVYLYTLPGGTMGTKACLDIRANGIDWFGSTGNRIAAAGSIAGATTTVVSQNITNVGLAHSLGTLDYELCNNNATNQQLNSLSLIMGSSTQVIALMATSTTAIDTTANAVIKLEVLQNDGTAGSYIADLSTQAQLIP